MPSKSPFTEAEEKWLQRAASVVWDHVAYDCLQATAEDKGRPIDDVSMSRAEVIEISLDASRPEQELKKFRLDAERRGNAEEVAVITGLLQKLQSSYTEKLYTYEQLKAAVKPAFPHARYGL